MLALEMLSQHPTDGEIVRGEEPRSKSQPQRIALASLLRWPQSPKTAHQIPRVQEPKSDKGKYPTSRCRAAGFPCFVHPEHRSSSVVIESLFVAVAVCPYSSSPWFFHSDVSALRSKE